MLPEHAELTTLHQTGRELDARIRDARIVVDDLTAEQEKIESDVDQVRARRQRDRDRMDQGLISNPKDLERMQGEMTSLERRITSLEDDQIEVMERLEEASAALDSLLEQMKAAGARAQTLTESRDRAVAAIEADLADIAGERAVLAADLPADLTALYDRLRAAKNGVGAAALHRGQCGGCRLTLDHAELAQIRSAADDDVMRCEECQRILVRTAESGL